MTKNVNFDFLERQYGIVFHPDQRKSTKYLSNDARLGLDAQPGLITQSNAGIPYYLTNYIDPSLIEVLTAPLNATKILPEMKKGDWTTRTATFPIVESAGEVSSYGDYSENGSTTANVNFPQRQSYHYQTMTVWGEQQIEMAGLARVDWAARLNISSALVLNKFQNLTYFFGVANLQNYGLLNDPSLHPPIAPGAKASNSGNSGPWLTNGAVTATASEIYSDIQALFTQLVLQSNGLVDMQTKMVLAMSPSSAVALTSTNQYNVNVLDQLAKNFPNLRVETATQYGVSSSSNAQGIAAGNLVQLIAAEIDGQQTAICAFTEKMRAHAIVLDTSSFKQKKSQGTWGTIIFQPFAISQMIGV